jgi:DNA-3-methyladenine glycosylase I
MINFDFDRVARFTSRDVARLMANEGIVRHQGEIEAAINNARRARELVKAEGSFAAFIWRHEPGKLDSPRRVAPLPTASLRAGADN